MSSPDPSSPSTGARASLAGLMLLALAIGFNASVLRSEIRVSRVPLNDHAFHRPAAERLVESVQRGEGFLDAWVSEWSLGYPLWRSYQPLPHLLAGTAMRLSSDPAAAFALLHYLLLVLLPLSMFAGARLLGLSPLAAGFTALLIAAPNGTGQMGVFSSGYASQVWRGAGLYTQLVAIHFLALAIGAASRAFAAAEPRSRWRWTLLAAALLAATTASHIIVGYIGFATAGVLALLTLDGAGRRVARLAVITATSLLLLLWFVVPLVLMSAEVNHSRWEDGWKWDSFGARRILGELFRGTLLDHGRAPLLTIAVLAALAVALVRWRDLLARRLAVLTLFWLVLFFGRETWGEALRLLAVPADLHVHRFQLAFELMAMLLAGWFAAWACDAARRRGKGAFLLYVILAAAFLGYLGRDRVAFMRLNEEWGDTTIEALRKEQADLDAALTTVRAILAERPGRVSAGKAATWGATFRVGSVPVYALLSTQRIPSVSFLYHAMSLPSDLMVMRDEQAASERALAVRAVIAPTSLAVPPHLKRRGQHGRFAVYESSGEGYFGVVNLLPATDGRDSYFDASKRWLETPSEVGTAVRFLPMLPGPRPSRFDEAGAPPAGAVIRETKDGERYTAGVRMQRDGWVTVRLSWHADLVARVDGTPAPLVRVTPGFGAVLVPPGEHTVAVTYEPGPLRAILFVLGLAGFGLAAAGLRRTAVTRFEEMTSRAGERLARTLSAPRVVAALLLGGAAVLALHPLLRGQLILGHDATCYPPRVTEYVRALLDGHVPPVWAPDLGAGHGQPIFAFVPPLLYAVAALFRLAGASLVDSVQFALFLLFLSGAVALYRIARRSASRGAALVAVFAWLVMPYLSLDLYVRSAFNEASGLAMAPVALLAILRLMDSPSWRRFGLAAAGVALVMLTHNFVALLVVPALGAVVVARRDLRRIAAGAGAIGTGLALSAFFWLPALLENDLVKTYLMRGAHFDWRLHILAPYQLLWSRWGYGFSGPGTADGMSFSIGPVQLLFAIGGVVVALRGLSSRRRAKRGGGSPSPPATLEGDPSPSSRLGMTVVGHPSSVLRDRSWCLETIVFALLAAGGTWLTTTWSAPLWERSSTLAYAQFPWRALLLPATFLPLVALPFFEWIGRSWRPAVVALLLVVNASHLTPERYRAVDDREYAAETIASTGLNTTTQEEYEPRWVSQRPPYEASRIAPQLGVQVREIATRAHRQEFELNAAAPAQVELTTFFYPGWKATIDGRDAAVTVVPVRGTMALSVPAGTHRVVLALRPTALRRGAGVVSLIALGLWIVAMLRTRRGSPLARIAAADGVVLAPPPGPGALLVSWRTRIAPPRSDCRIALLLASLFFILYGALTRGHFQSIEEISVYQTAQSLVERGSLAVYETSATTVGRDGAFFAQATAGQSVAAAPFYAAGRAVRHFLELASPSPWAARLAGPAIGTLPAQWGGTVEIFFASLFGPAVTALLAFVFYFLCRAFGGSARASIVMTLLLGGATYIGGMATSFWRHPAETLFLLIAFLLLVLDAREPRARFRAFAGLAMALAIAVRFEAAIALVPFGAYLLWNARARGLEGDARRSVAREAVPFFLWAFAGIAQHLLVNWLKYEQLTAPGSGQGPAAAPGTALAAYLVSPGMSILLFSPPLIAALMLSRSFLQRWRAEAVAIAGLAASYVMLHAMRGDWHGQWAFGPRYLAATVPFLLLPLAPALSRAAPWQRLAIFGLAAAGVWTQLVQLLVNFSYVYNARAYDRWSPPLGYLFSWRDSQLVAHSKALLGGDPAVDFWLWWRFQEGGSVALLMVTTPAAVLLGALAAALYRDLSSRRDGDRKPSEV